MEKKQKRIPVASREKNRFIPVFLLIMSVLTIISLLYLKSDWIKMFSRIPEIGEIFWELAHFNFAKIDIILSSLLETICIAVLSLIYSLLLGIVFGMLASRNITKVKGVAVFTQAFFTFLRAVPTPVWVLLMMVCLGMGPEAGVAGLCVHTYNRVFYKIIFSEF